MVPASHYIQRQYIVVILLCISDWRDAQSIVWHFRDWETCRNDGGGGEALLVLYPVVTELLTLWLHGVVVSGKAGSQAHRAVVFTLTVRWSRQPGTASPLTMDTFVFRLIYPCPFVLMRDLTKISYLQRWSNISEKLLLLSSERNMVLSSKLSEFLCPFSLLTILGPYTQLILQCFWF